MKSGKQNYYMKIVLPDKNKQKQRSFNYCILNNSYLKSLSFFFKLNYALT